MILLKIDYKPVSWNTLISNNHWHKSKVFNEMREATKYAVLSQKIKPITEFPVKVIVTAFWKHKHRHDAEILELRAARRISGQQ